MLAEITALKSKNAAMKEEISHSSDTVDDLKSKLASASKKQRELEAKCEEVFYIPIITRACSHHVCTRCPQKGQPSIAI